MTTEEESLAERVRGVVYEHQSADQLVGSSTGSPQLQPFSQEKGRPTVASDQSPSQQGGSEARGVEDGICEDPGLTSSSTSVNSNKSRPTSLRSGHRRSNSAAAKPSQLLVDGVDVDVMSSSVAKPEGDGSAGATDPRRYYMSSPSPSPRNAEAGGSSSSLSRRIIQPISRQRIHVPMPRERPDSSSQYCTVIHTNEWNEDEDDADSQNRHVAPLSRVAKDISSPGIATDELERKQAVAGGTGPISKPGIGSTQVDDEFGEVVDGPGTSAFVNALEGGATDYSLKKSTPYPDEMSSAQTSAGILHRTADPMQDPEHPMKPTARAASAAPGITSGAHAIAISPPQLEADEEGTFRPESQSRSSRPARATTSAYPSRSAAAQSLQTQLRHAASRNSGDRNQQFPQHHQAQYPNPLALQESKTPRSSGMQSVPFVQASQAHLVNLRAHAHTPQTHTHQLPRTQRGTASFVSNSQPPPHQLQLSHPTSPQVLYQMQHVYEQSVHGSSQGQQTPTVSVGSIQAGGRLQYEQSPCMEFSPVPMRMLMRSPSHASQLPSPANELVLQSSATLHPMPPTGHLLSANAVTSVDPEVTVDSGTYAVGPLQTPPSVMSVSTTPMPGFQGSSFQTRLTSNRHASSEFSQPSHQTKYPMYTLPTSAIVNPEVAPYFEAFLAIFGAQKAHIKRKRYFYKHVKPSHFDCFKHLYDTTQSEAGDGRGDDDTECDTDVDQTFDHTLDTEEGCGSSQCDFSVQAPTNSAIPALKLPSPSAQNPSSTSARVDRLASVGHVAQGPVTAEAFNDQLEKTKSETDTASWNGEDSIGHSATDATSPEPKIVPLSTHVTCLPPNEKFPLDPLYSDLQAKRASGGVVAVADKPESLATSTQPSSLDSFHAQTTTSPALTTEAMQHAGSHTLDAGVLSPVEATPLTKNEASATPEPAALGKAPQRALRPRSNSHMGILITPSLKTMTCHITLGEVPRRTANQKLLDRPADWLQSYSHEAFLDPFDPFLVETVLARAKTNEPNPVLSDPLILQQIEHLQSKVEAKRGSQTNRSSNSRGTQSHLASSPTIVSTASTASVASTSSASSAMSSSSKVEYTSGTDPSATDVDMARKAQQKRQQKLQKKQQNKQKKAIPESEMDAMARSRHHVNGNSIFIPCVPVWPQNEPQESMKIPNASSPGGSVVTAPTGVQRPKLIVPVDALSAIKPSKPTLVNYPYYTRCQLTVPRVLPSPSAKDQKAAKLSYGHNTGGTTPRGGQGGKFHHPIIVGSGPSPTDRVLPGRHPLKPQTTGDTKPEPKPSPTPRPSSVEPMTSPQKPEPASSLREQPDPSTAAKLTDVVIRQSQQEYKTNAHERAKAAPTVDTSDTLAEGSISLAVANEQELQQADLTPRLRLPADNTPSETKTSVITTNSVPSSPPTQLSIKPFGAEGTEGDVAISPPSTTTTTTTTTTKTTTRGYPVGTQDIQVQVHTAMRNVGAAPSSKPGDIGEGRGGRYRSRAVEQQVDGSDVGESLSNVVRATSTRSLPSDAVAVSDGLRTVIAAASMNQQMQSVPVVSSRPIQHVQQLPHPATVSSVHQLSSISTVTPSQIVAVVQSPEANGGQVYHTFPSHVPGYAVPQNPYAITRSAVVPLNPAVPSPTQHYVHPSVGSVAPAFSPAPATMFPPTQIAPVVVHNVPIGYAAPTQQPSQAPPPPPLSSSTATASAATAAATHPARTTSPAAHVRAAPAYSVSPNHGFAIASVSPGQPYYLNSQQVFYVLFDSSAHAGTQFVYLPQGFTSPGHAAGGAVVAPVTQVGSLAPVASVASVPPLPQAPSVPPGSNVSPQAMQNTR